MDREIHNGQKVAVIGLGEQNPTASDSNKEPQIVPLTQREVRSDL
jgi:hypothetical protein